jgi:hypothetical protein
MRRKSLYDNKLAVVITSAVKHMFLPAWQGALVCSKLRRFALEHPSVSFRVRPNEPPVGC